MSFALSSPLPPASARTGAWKKPSPPVRDSFFRSAGAKLFQKPSAAASCGNTIKDEVTCSLPSSSAYQAAEDYRLPKYESHLHSLRCSTPHFEGDHATLPGSVHRMTMPSIPSELEELLNTGSKSLSSTAGNSLDTSGSTYSCAPEADDTWADLSDAGTDSTGVPYSELGESLERRSCASSMRLTSFSSCSSVCPSTPRNRSCSKSSCESTPELESDTYSIGRAGSSSSSSVENDNQHGGVSARGQARYTSQKVASWFRQVVDAEGIGAVDFRRFLAALRRHPGLQAVLSDAADVQFDAEERTAHRRLHATGPRALSVPERSDLLLKERARVKAIFHQICDGGDRLEFSSFMKFFNRRGLVLHHSR